jgi:acetyl-CoA carboxylase biotin carboxylase subunit
MSMFENILIANRGAAASRILRACRELGTRTTVVYSPADADLPYVQQADRAIAIGEPPAAKSYLDQNLILDAARHAKADAIHPGYGFLSENPGFATAVSHAGLTFIGPKPSVISLMGEKTQARAFMRERGMPMARNSRALPDDEAEILAAGEDIGYPVLVKPANGGGGIGMIAARNAVELVAAVAKARTAAQRAFADSSVYLEQLLERPRHIEFQVVADRYGNACHLFERDCSVQRRHQKVIEEAPAPGLSRDEVDAMAARIVPIIAALGYSTIGTVEMLHEPSSGFLFLEMNTRLQVEHAVTEEVTGVDLVQAQIRLAAGEELGKVVPSLPPLRGHAIQARIYAEDPVRFLPSPGPLTEFSIPGGEGIRVESGFAKGCVVSPYYDPMIAKVIARGPDRASAIARLREALAQVEISGVRTNIPFLLQVLDDECFRDGRVHTGLTAEILSTSARGES